MKKACDKSLSRLQLDQIDLYYCHRLDGTTPIEKTMEALKELKQEGKIKYIGLSECSSDSLSRACKVDHVDAVQIEYSPFSLDIESDQIGLLKTARELGVAIVAYSPIGRGMLGGQIRSPKDFEEGDFRTFAPRFSEENFPKNLQLVDRITEIASKKSATPSQLTLAWILAQGDDFFPVSGLKIRAVHTQLTANRFRVQPTQLDLMKTWARSSSISPRRKSRRFARHVKVLRYTVAGTQKPSPRHSSRIRHLSTHEG